MTEPGFIASTMSLVHSRRLAVGDQGGGDDDVHFRRQFAELGQLRVRGTQGLGLDRGIAASGRAILLFFLEIEIRRIRPPSIRPARPLRAARRRHR